MLRKAFKVSFVFSVIVLLFAPAAAADMQLPFYGRFLGTESSFAPPDGGCAAGRTRLFASGTAVVMHMGNVTWSETVCLDMQTLQFNTEAVITAANGDQLNLTVYKGQGERISDTVMRIESQWVFSGGTGRFSGATGAGKAEGIVDLFGLSPHTLTGWISNIGQSK